MAPISGDCHRICETVYSAPEDHPAVLAPGRSSASPSLGRGVRNQPSPPGLGSPRGGNEVPEGRKNRGDDASPPHRRSAVLSGLPVSDAPPLSDAPPRHTRTPLRDVKSALRRILKTPKAMRTGVRGRLRPSLSRLPRLSRRGLPVVFGVGCDAIPVPINGKRAKLNVCCFSGNQQIRLDSPAGCFDPIPVACP